MDYQAAEPPDESSESARPGQLPVTSSPVRGQWKAVAVRIWNKIFEDEIFGRAAQLAYYWLFSIFPFLILLTSLISDAPVPKDTERLLYELRRTIPREAYDLVYQTFHDMTGQEGHGFLSFSFLLVIWAASTGMSAVISSLNKTFEVQNSRSWWMERILAILLTLGLAIFITAALILMFFDKYIYDFLLKQYGDSSIFPTIWSLAQWPVTIFLVLFAVEMVYYFAPNIKQKWELFTPGAIFALICWLVISYGFRYYVTNFANYNFLYGALGGLMVLMIWLYLMGVAILSGGVINSVMKREYETNEK
ncbi:MAG: YihY/virulence factor BrkB family protein [Acidobacteria bacterium]|nr:YihY/virulence factor BrkB family protein [Acidobacteriota bacterium]